jgi:uncharacterized protein (TIRG00374 family)
VLVFVAVVDYLVLPQLAGTQRSLHLLGTVRVWWVVVGVLLEALSLAAYSMLTRAILQGSGPGYGWLLRADLTGLGVSHLVPGGGATATALRYRMLTLGGTGPEAATVGVAIEAVGSVLALAAVFWTALVAALLVLGPNPLYAVTAALGAVLGTCVIVAVRERSRFARPAGQALRFLLRRLPARVRPRVATSAAVAGTHLRLLLDDRMTLRACATWAIANWLLDAASLWVFLAAYGYRINPVALLIAYGTANLLAVLPISPGGLGIIEGALIPSLLAFGAPGGVAVLGVVSWRLFQFWAPIPVAGACYLSLRVERWWNDHEAAA